MKIEVPGHARSIKCLGDRCNWRAHTPLITWVTHKLQAFAGSQAAPAEHQLHRDQADKAHKVMKQWTRVVMLSLGLQGVVVAKDWQQIPWMKPDDRIPDAVWQAAVAVGRDRHSAVNLGIPLPDGIAGPLRGKVKMTVSMHMSYGLTHASVWTRLVSTTKEWQSETAYVTICRSHHVTECAAFGPLSAWVPKASTAPEAPNASTSAASEASDSEVY